MNTDDTLKRSAHKNICAQKYVTTDMAIEQITDAQEGITVSESERNGFHIHHLTVDRPCGEISIPGRYITLTLGRPWLQHAEMTCRAAETVSEIIRELCPATSDGNSKNGIESILTVCLGNRKVTADAVGPLCSDGLIATRHLKTERTDLWRELGSVDISALTPGVSGETGMEAYELVSAAAEATRAQLIITVDALSARDTERLGTSVQITDSGIAPGSGVGNRRTELSSRTLGVPVISIGVPTVAHSATLIRDALEKAEINLNSPSLEAALSVGRSFFVTARDTDAAVASMADIISRAVNLTFLGFQKL